MDSLICGSGSIELGSTYTIGAEPLNSKPFELRIKLGLVFIVVDGLSQLAGLIGATERIESLVTQSTGKTDELNSFKLVIELLSLSFSVLLCITFLLVLLFLLLFLFMLLL